ncbi:MAG: acyl-CoA dehydratase activase-related protein [Collinsella sp.]
MPTPTSPVWATPCCLPDTTEQVRLAQENARGETCYPVKLIYGHMAWLAEREPDYIFMPSLHTIRHASSRVAHNYACPYMQTAPRLVADALGLERRGIELLNPLLDMDFGQEAMAQALLGLGEQLGHTRQEAAVAMMAGGFAVTSFGEKTEALGDELLGSLAPGERVLVLITRNYGISDGALNMGIPEILLDRGQKVVTLGHLHAHDIDVSADHPGICWPFGQHILRAPRWCGAIRGSSRCTSPTTAAVPTPCSTSSSPRRWVRSPTSRSSAMSTSAAWA